MLSPRPRVPHVSPGQMSMMPRWVSQPSEPKRGAKCQQTVPPPPHLLLTECSSHTCAGIELSELLPTTSVLAIRVFPQSERVPWCQGFTRQEGQEGPTRWTCKCSGKRQEAIRKSVLFANPGFPRCQEVDPFLRAPPVDATYYVDRQNAIAEGVKCNSGHKLVRRPARSIFVMGALSPLDTFMVLN